MADRGGGRADAARGPARCAVGRPGRPVASSRACGAGGFGVGAGDRGGRLGATPTGYGRGWCSTAPRMVAPAACPGVRVRPAVDLLRWTSTGCAPTPRALSAALDRSPGGARHGAHARRTAAAARGAAAAGALRQARPAAVLLHRDFQRAFERALRRADVPMAFSRRLPPHPKVSYASAAPTGAASEAEYVEISVTQRATRDAAGGPGRVAAARPGRPRGRRGRRRAPLADRLEASVADRAGRRAAAAAGGGRRPAGRGPGRGRAA